MVDAALKPYLTRSAAAHGGLLLFAALAGLGTSSRPREEVYRIDFIGPTAGILNQEPLAEPAKAAAPAPAAAKPPPQTDPDAFSLRRRVGRLLPRPSFLGGPEKPSATPAQAPAPSAKAGQGAEPASAQVSADMPDFPYPWYLSRLRALLWERWSARRGQAAGRCEVSFSVLRDGLLTDLRVASTSGEESFDYAGLSAVQDAAPFPPLPDGFAESFLKVRVEFKAD